MKNYVAMSTTVFRKKNHDYETVRGDLEVVY